LKSNLNEITSPFTGSESTMFKKAGRAEIIRSHQKDDYYISDLKSQITDIFQALIGTYNQLSCHFVDLQRDNNSSVIYTFLQNDLTKGFWGTL
jgi:site-specific DNA-adenine methylase